MQAVGFLYLLGAFVMTIVGLANLVMRLGFATSVDNVVYAAWVGVALIQGWTGWHLRSLDNRARTPTLVLPVGTLINAYILYLLLCAKGKYVFSSDYRAVIDASPRFATG